MDQEPAVSLADSGMDEGMKEKENKNQEEKVNQLEKENQQENENGSEKENQNQSEMTAVSVAGNGKEKDGGTVEEFAALQKNTRVSGRFTFKSYFL